MLTIFVDGRIVLGLLFGLQYSLSYTAARSFAAPPYNYDALKVGLVLLSFGVGNIVSGPPSCALESFLEAPR